ncbi:hypothetical protein L1077_27015 [Pseudoalteromonas luteoviolacea]|uniref:hypothetical protein n=1 Tax=Pseudoalteromonas luteoviolacea TaxID=43657 RepID=UPI001F302946|nr:hypothetical protein [Pseudoalteromonas luteoviolacea]MCF6443082.1 hypothetical protein [Pseudoalteromonas luteoviolacea]
MLLDYQKIGSAQIEKELKMVQGVYTQEAFLSGLFLGSYLPNDLDGFRIFSDPYNLDTRIQTPDDYMDEPEKWEFKHFNDILGWNEGTKGFYKGFYKDYDDVLALKKEYKCILYGFLDDFYDLILQRIAKYRSKEHEQLIRAKYSLTARNVEYLYVDLIPDIILEHFYEIVSEVIFGGLSKSTINTRVLDCYRLGGMPGGWVGPHPRDGGLAKDCMELYHLGS